MAKGLGRRVPKDDNHIRKYSLLAEDFQIIKPTPICVGVNWYSDFDNPVKDTDGKYWVGKNPNNLGYLRGGHCVCQPQDFKKDLLSWYRHYNQGDEGACVGFGSSRMMSLLNRKQYNAWWLWDRAKEVDEWEDTNPGDSEGTSVRAAFDILRARGHMAKRGRTEKLVEGISQNKWATTVEQAFSVLQNPLYEKLSAIPFFNSWGESYPRITWMPCETWQRLMNEDGEFTMAIDR